MSLLEINGLRKVYGGGAQARTAVEDLTLEVTEGEVVCVIGPSGCGKTTLLRCIAGLLPPTAGTLVLRGRPIVRPPADMALVFQEYNRSLFPWMTMRQNIGFPLRRLRLGRDAERRRVDEAAASVGLTGSLDLHPWQLSGGMQQRAAIGRALAYQPSILLMDEPFASIDAQARADLEDLTLHLCRTFQMTVLFVTHDIDESIYLGDRVVVLSRSPARIRGILAVDLAKPRNQVATKGDVGFSRLRAEVHRLIAGPD